MTKSVAVLGCGPAGLMVAHAASLEGWDFAIYSKKVKSKLFGAQYLHEPISKITGEDPEDGAVMLSYRLRGTPEEYRHKVYGPSWDGNTSPEDYAGDHYAWDLRSAYDKMWGLYCESIHDCDLRDVGRRVIEPEITSNGHDLVISTIPRTVWDNDNSHFKSSTIWAHGGYELGDLRQENNSVICDGTNLANWYRSAMIFGQGTMEWPQWWNIPYASVTPPVPGAVRVAKPLAYTGNAAQDFIHLGRYAQWTKGVLTSDVFTGALKALRDDRI